MLKIHIAIKVRQEAQAKEGKRHKSTFGNPCWRLEVTLLKGLMRIVYNQRTGTLDIRLQAWAPLSTFSRKNRWLASKAPIESNINPHRLVLVGKEIPTTTLIRMLKTTRTLIWWTQMTATIWKTGREHQPGKEEAFHLVLRRSCLQVQWTKSCSTAWSNSNLSSKIIVCVTSASQSDRTP